MEKQTDKYRIDSHKLIYHVPRLFGWLNGKTTYPVYMEISPTGFCNHRCLYCGLDFMRYQPRHLNTALLKKRISELGRLGLKSIMYAGEGEPFAHRDMAEIIRHTKRSGIDTAVTTNGVLFKKEIADSVLGSCEWIKVGIDGATGKTYAKIHRCRDGDFDTVIRNISYAVKLKKDKKFRCTLGAQLLLLPENYHEAPKLAKLLKGIGMDYLIIKPYSQHPQSKTKIYRSIKYGDYEYLAGELSGFNTGNFSVIFRMNTMKKWDVKERHYCRCLAFPFWSYIDAGGNVWGCSVYLGDSRFFYGNIYESVFKKIWEGSRRSRSIRWAERNLDVSGCRINCRMDEANRFLWDLRNPPPHVNFI